MVVVNLDLAVHHSLIFSNFQYMIVETVSYPSSYNTSSCLDEKPKTLVIVVSKSTCAIEILVPMSFKVTCDDFVFIFMVWRRDPSHTCISIPTYYH